MITVDPLIFWGVLAVAILALVGQIGKCQCPPEDDKKEGPPTTTGGSPA